MAYIGNSFIISQNTLIQQQFNMITTIEQLIQEIQTQRSPKLITTTTRTRWNQKEQILFEQLVARFGNDYKLLGNFLPRKTDKQIRKRYRYLIRYRHDRLSKIEQEISTRKRKQFFDQNFMQETDSSSSQCSHPSLPDLSPQSLP